MSTERERARSRESYARNRATIRAKSRAKYAAEREAQLAYAKAWRAANPGKVRAYKMKGKYGLTHGQYAALGYTCEICGKLVTAGRDRTVDHNHDTGAVRGLLCRNCNAGIGQLKDSADLCIRAAEYLLRKDPS